MHETAISWREDSIPTNVFSFVMGSSGMVMSVDGFRNDFLGWQTPLISSPDLTPSKEYVEMFL